ncbi:MAG: PilZ domain-containing protein [Acidobacteriaceae bacterium]|nr:PilZ domain-containing protein [Acidobacteriaceae bacterium]
MMWSPSENGNSLSTDPLVRQSRPGTVGNILVVSPDHGVVGQISEILREHALAVAAVHSASVALDRLHHNKFEAVIIDWQLDQAVACLHRVRSSPANRTAVALALTRDSEETTKALRQGFSFVLERPLSPESIRHTLKVAYGLIVRERRRYFRYPVIVPVVLSRKNAPEVFGRTVNVSENGMALRSSVPLVRDLEGMVQFTLPDPALQITAEAKVCWNDERGNSGLQFLFMPSDLASHLQSWLGQKLEEELPQAVAEKFRQAR